MNELLIVIITGMSGAGKSTALHFFEDKGFYCVDNLPPALIPVFVDLCTTSKRVTRVALGIDIRGGQFFEVLDESLRMLKEQEYPYKILFLEAEVEILVRRFKETRRRHPLNEGERLIESISKEREELMSVRKIADHIINTSDLRSSQLRETLEDYFFCDSYHSNLITTIMSFGFKNGLPLDADLVFDVRFLPNPYYDPSLRPLRGTDASVQKYIWKNKVTHTFAEKLLDLITFLLPYYEEEGKTQLVIAIGCTGGHHRSVAMACHLYEQLKLRHFRVVIAHRDIFKER